MKLSILLIGICSLLVVFGYEKSVVHKWENADRIVLDSTAVDYSLYLVFSQRVHNFTLVEADALAFVRIDWDTLFIDRKSIADNLESSPIEVLLVQEYEQ